MEQRILLNRAHRFETENSRGEFDSLFDANSIVDKRKREQLENRIW